MQDKLKKIIRFIWLVVLLVTIYLFNAASFFGGDRITVASKIDGEGALLGQLTYQLLSAHNLPVEDKTTFGNTFLLRNAILDGIIDIYPEYTGNGQIFFPKLAAHNWRELQLSMKALNQADKKNDLIWLKPSLANNIWSLAISTKLQKKENLYSYHDLARYLQKDGFFKLACSKAYLESPHAFPAFVKAYGIDINKMQIMAFAGGNTAVTLKAAYQGTNDINASMAYSSSDAIDEFEFTLLEDPLKVQPIFAPTILARKAILKRYPQIKPLLEELFQTLTNRTLRRLNQQISIYGQPPKSVAIEFLNEQGLL